MIILKNFRIEEEPDLLAVKCDIVGDGFPRNLTFRTTKDQYEAIDIDEPNWAAIALIYPAMLLGQDINIEADLSPRLLYNMQNDLGSLLHSFEPLAKRIKVNAGVTREPGQTIGKNVATGFSGGVDSFATTMLFGGSEMHKSMRLSALALFDVGALGKTGDVDDVFLDGQKRVSEYAGRMGWNKYFVSADFDALFSGAASKGPTDFVKTVCLRNAAAAMVLQKGIGTYLSSSSVAWRSVTCGPFNYTGIMAPIMQPLFSTEGLRFQSAGAGLSRLEKVSLISNNSDTWTRLDICVGRKDLRHTGKGINCSRCWKCVPTILLLEALGKVDHFESIFDLEYYRANRNRLLQATVDRAHMTGMWAETIEFARGKGLSVPKPRLAVRRVAGRIKRALLGR